MIFPPFWRFIVFQFVSKVIHAQTPRAFSESVLYLRDIDITVNGDFETTNQAHLIVDFKVSFGNLRGSVTTRGKEQCELMVSSRDITCRISEVVFMVSNPVNAIYVEALPSLDFFKQGRAPEILPTTALFNLRNETFNATSPVRVSTVLNGRRWPITFNYRKGCNDEHYYGFQCNVQCFQPRETECYQCNVVTGEKICCNDTDVDQGTCLYKDGVIPPGRNCDERLAFLGREYDSATARRDLFFWLMFGFILLFVLALLLLIMAIVWAFTNKRKYEESKEYIINRDYNEQEPFPQTYPQAVRNLNNNTNRDNLQIDQYDRSLRRKREPPQSPTPERKRRNMAFEGEDDDESSVMDYLPFHQQQRQPYAVSTILPPPQRRRRLEQVV